MPPQDAAAPTIVTVSALSSQSKESGMVTGEGHPIEIRVLSPWKILAVRAARVYFQTLSGLVVAGLVAPTAIPAKDFIHLVLTCASLSVASAGVSLLQNLAELFGKIDQKYPSLTA